MISLFGLSFLLFALANYVNRTIVIYLSIDQCARVWPLSDSLKLYRKIRKYSLGRFYVSYLGYICVRKLPIKRKRNNHVLKLRQNYVRKLR